MPQLTLHSGVADGGIVSTGNANDYAEARDGTGTLSAGDGDDSANVGQLSTGTLRRIWEVFIGIDVSPLADLTTVGGTLSLWLESDSSTDDFIVEARVFDWGDTLTEADWVPGDDLSGLTLVATRDTDGIGATGEYKAFTSAPAMTTAIANAAAGDGILRLVLCSDRTTDNIEPSPDTIEVLHFSLADATGTSQDPMLVVDYIDPNPTLTVPATAALSAADNVRTVPATAALSLNGVTEALVQVAADDDDRIQISGSPDSIDGGIFSVGTDDLSFTPNQHNFWRFLNVGIEQGYSILSATVQMRKLTTQWQAHYWTWHGEYSGNVTSVTGPIDTRPKTTASVIENTNVERTEGTWYAWDVRDIVQEIVNHPEWASGNNLALITEGNGPASFARTLWYQHNDDPDSAAILTIHFQSNVSVLTTPATAALQATLAATVPATAVLSRVSTLTIAASASLSETGTTLGVPVTAALSAVETKTVPATAALIEVSERTIPATAALQASFTKTLPATAALLRALTRSVPATAVLSELGAVTMTVTATAALSRPVLIISPGRQGPPEFSLTLYGPLPGKRLVNQLALPPEVALTFASELPGGWSDANAGIVREELRRTLTATEVQAMLLPEPVGVPAFGHAEIHSDGGHLVWEGRVSARRQVGGEVRGVSLTGYGITALRDGEMPGRSGRVTAGVVAMTALRDSAPLIEPLEINDPGVAWELSEFSGRQPYDVLEAVSDTGCGTCPGWTWTVYNRQLHFFPLIPPATPTYRVDADETIERDLDNEGVYTAVVLTYTDLDGTVRRTPVLRDPEAEARFGVSRILPLSGGTMTPTAAIAFARSELLRRTVEGVAMRVNRTWKSGLLTSYGGTRPIWDVQAGETLQVGDEPIQHITSVSYDQVAGRGAVALGEPIFPLEVAVWRRLVAAETAVRSGRDVLTRTNRGT